MNFLYAVCLESSNSLPDFLLEALAFIVTLFWIYVWVGIKSLINSVRAFSYRSRAKDKVTAARFFHTRELGGIPLDGLARSKGTISLPEGQPIFSPLSSTPCCYWQVVVRKRIGFWFRQVAVQSSGLSMSLNDEYGSIAVDGESFSRIAVSCADGNENDLYSLEGELIFRRSIGVEDESGDCLFSIPSDDGKGSLADQLGLGDQYGNIPVGKYFITEKTVTCSSFYAALVGRVGQTRDGDRYLHVPPGERGVMVVSDSLGSLDRVIKNRFHLFLQGLRFGPTVFSMIFIALFTGAMLLWLNSGC